jgi:hypothetical protein
MHAIRSYLEGSLRISSKLELEKHIRHCRICSEALEGFNRQKVKEYLRSDLEFLSGKIRKRFASARTVNRKLPVLITFSIIVSLMILLIIFYLIRQFLLNM